MNILPWAYGGILADGRLQTPGFENRAGSTPAMKL